MSVVFALLTSVMWGVGDFLGGVATRKLHQVVVVMVSQFFGLLAVAAYGFFSHANWDWRAAPWAVLAAIGGDVGLLAFYKALSTGRMGIVSPIASLGAVVPLAAGLIAGDRPRVLQAVGIAVAVLGVVMSSGPELSGDADAKPVLLAFVAALGFGCALLGIAGGSEYSVITTTVLMRFVTVGALALALPFMKAAHGFKIDNWWLLIAIGVLDVGANVTFGLASSTGLLSLVSVLGSIYPVVTALLAWRILHERLLKIQYAGVLLTMLGVAAIVGG